MEQSGQYRAPARDELATLPKCITTEPKNVHHKVPTMPISEEKLNQLKRDRLNNDGGLLDVSPEEVTALTFNRHSEALKLKDPLQHAAIQRSITLRFYQSQMIPTVDYGPVQGCGPKPVLFKSGAEKLASLFDLAIAIDPIKEFEDWEKGVFGYTYKATVKDRKNRPVAECVGSCNTREKKFLKQDPFSIQNTVMKMGQKRAIVGAVLLATNASNLFANGEIELKHDLTQEGDRPTWEIDAEIIDESTPPVISQAQVKRLFAIAKVAGHTKESLYKMLLTMGIESTRAITPHQYDGICQMASNPAMAEFFTSQTIAGSVAVLGATGQPVSGENG